MQVVNKNIIPSQAAATVTTEAVTANQLFACSAQITTTGAGAAGVLKLQASNDNFTSSVAPANWTDISSATVTVAAPGVMLIPKTDLCYNWIRLVYTNSGTGTVSVVLQAQGV